MIMTSSFVHQSFSSPSRVSQSLCNDRCQNILYKAVFEHFIEIKTIAALLLASKFFQNSSFGANFVVNFVVNDNVIALLESVLCPSSCFSLQFVPSLHIRQEWRQSETTNRGISKFVGEMINTKYFHLSLQSLTLYSETHEVLSFFFGGSSTSNAWPQLRDVSSKLCGVNDCHLASIVESAIHLRAVSFAQNSGITDAGLEKLSHLSGITSLDLSFCNSITDAGLEHVSKLPCITILNLCKCSEITDAGVEHVAKISGITSLNLCCCDNITDACLEHVTKLSSLTALDMSYCRTLTDDGLALIAKISSVTFLDLSFCYNISDVGLEHVAELSNLITLNLHGDDTIADETKQKLKTALPRCTIYG